MNRLFKKINSDRVNVVKHTLDILKENPNVRIHVGCDSQNIGKKRFKTKQTAYATVIAYHYEGSKGVHYILSMEHVSPMLPDKSWEKLWGEVERSIEVAQWLKTNIPSIEVQIDLDFNSDEEEWSNKLVNASSGYITALGFKANVKPFMQIATHAADHHVRK